MDFQGTRPNEVWRLNDRRLGIIVDNATHNNNQLLYMSETGKLCICDIRHKLDYLTSIGADEVMLEWFDELRQNQADSK